MKTLLRGFVSAVPLFSAAAAVGAAAGLTLYSGAVDAAAPGSTSSGATQVVSRTERMPASVAAALDDGHEISGRDGGARLDPLTQRLQDPQQRAAIRAEQRASVREDNPDLAQVLGLDEATEATLIDILADHRMRQLEMSQSPIGGTEAEWLRGRADAQTKQLDDLRTLLGQNGIERYQDYSATLLERVRVSRLDARLAADQKLGAAQKEQLMPLFRESMRRRYERPGSSFEGVLSGSLHRPMPDQPRDVSALGTIASSEDHLRAAAQSHRWLSEQTAGILTQPQRAVMTEMNAEEEGSLKQRIERARRQAGLDPSGTVPVELPPAPTRKPRDGQIKLDITLTVNDGQSTVFSRVVPNGEVVVFEAAGGLLVEATPTMNDSGWLDMRLAYYEKGSTGKRRLGEEASIISQTQEPDSTLTRGERGTVITGSKAYAVNASYATTAM